MRAGDPLPLLEPKIYVLAGYDRPHRQTSQYIPVALQCDGFFIMYQAVRKALQVDRQTRSTTPEKQPTSPKPVPNLCPYLPRSDWDDRKDLWDIFRRLWIVERAFQILFRFRPPILFDVWCARKETWKLNFFQRKEFFYDI